VGEKMHKDYLKNFHANFYEDILLLVKRKKFPYSIRHYDKENVIALNGQPCIFVGIVLNGQLKIEQNQSDGKKTIINTLKRYDIFGEILLFTEQPIYPYDIITSTNCDILFISKAILLKIFNEDLNLLEKYLYHISKSYMNLNQVIKLKSQKTIVSKLAYYFIHYMNITENNLECKIDSRTQLAELLGIERQSLFRTLKYLTDNERIYYEGKSIYIKDFYFFKQLIE